MQLLHYILKCNDCESSFKYNTVDGFIFMGTSFRGLNENDTFIGFKIRGRSIFLHNSYKKSLIRGYFNSWI